MESRALNLAFRVLLRESQTYHPAGMFCPLSHAGTFCLGKPNPSIRVLVFLSAGSLSRMLRWDNQKAPSQVICGSRSESQTVLELERTQKATLQMRKLRLIGLPKATQLFISNARAGPPRGREPQGILLGKICQPIGHKLADKWSFSIRERWDRSYEPPKNTRHASM